MLMSIRAIIILPGYFKLPLPGAPRSIRSTSATPSSKFFSLSELYHCLKDVHGIFRSNPILFAEHAHYFKRHTPIHRLLELEDDEEYHFIRNSSHVISICRLACLFWIFAIFIEHGQSPESLGFELEKLRLRLVRHGLDHYGSNLMLCELLLKEENSVEVHIRGWQLVRIMNLVKAWGIERQDDLASLLYGYLSCTYSLDVEGQHYERVMNQIKLDLEAD